MGYTYTCELWDANSLKAVFSDEGIVENNIEIDVNKFSKAIPCFKTSSDKSIETYLASFPGDFIAEIYNKYEEEAILNRPGTKSIQIENFLRHFLSWIKLARNKFQIKHWEV